MMKLISVEVVFTQRHVCLDFAFNYLVFEQRETNRDMHGE